MDNTLSTFVSNRRIYFRDKKYKDHTYTYKCVFTDQLVWYELLIAIDGKSII